MCMCVCRRGYHYVYTFVCVYMHRYYCACVCIYKRTCLCMCEGMDTTVCMVMTTSGKTGPYILLN